MPPGRRLDLIVRGIEVQRFQVRLVHMPGGVEVDLDAVVLGIPEIEGPRVAVIDRLDPGHVAARPDVRRLMPA